MNPKHVKDLAHVVFELSRALERSRPLMIFRPAFFHSESAISTEAYERGVTVLAPAEKQLGTTQLKAADQQRMKSDAEETLICHYYMLLNFETI